MGPRAPADTTPRNPAPVRQRACRRPSVPPPRDCRSARPSRARRTRAAGMLRRPRQKGRSGALAWRHPRSGPADVGGETAEYAKLTGLRGSPPAERKGASPVLRPGAHRPEPLQGTAVVRILRSLERYLRVIGSEEGAAGRSGRGAVAPPHAFRFADELSEQVRWCRTL